MSNIAPSVSVIVPTCNSARTLDACLLSIRLQTYKSIELIVVDNYSIDETVEIAKRHADIVDIFGPERSSQRNRGTRLARGEYFLFIDSDMYLTPEVIADCFAVITTSRAPGVIIPEESIGEGFWARCRALERSCYVGDDSIEAARFYRRAAFEQAGGFDEELDAFEDWDLSRRLASGHQLWRTKSSIFHDEGKLKLRALLGKKRRYARSMVAYWRKHGRSTAGQVNLVLRPAILRNWRRLMRRPVLATGVLSMKTLEMIAAGYGLIEASLGAGSNHRLRRRSC